uniref:t-SNARE coiled-coil homology domain-containing protein n=1 Tax=Rhizochromulina marina TaxID=1034831 RepID=A0A7S2SJP4_9STRA|mmetsp:Transcript_3131/g.9055  ORF Transcript_3131/g.9055 Transcript_3131/m.9055 type:complete len:404 (+) Transcript_3131:16-1227(+)
MDATAAFHRVVQQVSGAAPGADQPRSSTAHPQSPMDHHSRDLLRNLESMRRFVRKTEPRYIQVEKFLSTDEELMTEKEKDDVDRQLAQFIQESSRSIQHLQSLVAKGFQVQAPGEARASEPGRPHVDEEFGLAPGSGRAIEHGQGAVLALLDRLQDLSTSVACMQSIRYHRTLDARTPFSGWLPPDTSLSSHLGSGRRDAADHENLEGQQSAAEEAAFLESVCPSWGTICEGKSSHGASSLTSSEAPPAPRVEGTRGPPKPGHRRRPLSVAEDVNDGASSAPAVLQEHSEGPRQSRATPLQQLEQENGELAASLQSELDDVVKIETKMREITELMHLFSAKVAQQQEDVTSIHNMTEEAGDDIDKGLGELVRSAKATRMFRVIYVAFTLILTLLLVLLDFAFG